MADKKGLNIPRLVAIPAVITLAVTILRVYGELHHWPAPWFSTAAGGGGAVVGISWLPIIFGPYFALKLASKGEGPASSGKAIGYAFLGLVVFILGGWLLGKTFLHPSPLTFAMFFLMLLAGFIPALGWRSLGRALLDYALLARIPVLVVMWFAMSGNNGAGWGTHYDNVGPEFAHMALQAKFLYLAIMPQLTLWIGFTSIVGGIFGGIVNAVANRGKQVSPANA